jgi:hypothetical protein
MIKLQENVNGHTVVVEADQRIQSYGCLLTAWIDGYTYYNRLMTDAQDLRDPKPPARTLMNMIKKYLESEAIVRYTFTDRAGNLHYWRHCSNLDQVFNAHFQPIWPEA